MNFALFLEMRARSAPSEIALVDRSLRLTWREFDEFSSRFAGLLDQMGVRPGDRVAAYLPNCAEMVIGFLGSLKAGAVFVPCNARLTGEELGRVLEHCAPRLLLTSQERSAALPAKVAPELLIDRGGADHFWESLAGAPVDFRMVGLQNHAIANLIYTSGTTGLPKAAIHTHGVRAAIAGGMADVFRLSIHDVALVASPLFHISGLNVLCNALFAGAKIVLLDKWNLEEFLRLLRAEGVTYMQLVSTILVDIANAPAELFAAGSTAVRFVWGGGHAVDPDTIRLFEKRIGGLFLQGWGRTEGGFTYNVLDPERRRFDAHGIANGNTSEVAVMDLATGLPMAVGETGEIVVRGDGISPGYWDGDFTRVRTPLDGGWQPTGDLGYFDGDGQMHFVGRSDHMIKTGGENVYPSEIAAVLLATPGVSDAVVIGIPHPRLGHLIGAVVVPSGPEMTVEEVERACRQSLAGFKIPRRIVLVPELPRLSNQKADLSACRALLVAAAG